MEQTKDAPRSCKKCGKEIESGKYCGVCQAEVRERNQKMGKYVLRAVGVAGTLAIAIITRTPPSSDGNRFL